MKKLIAFALFALPAMGFAQERGMQKTTTTTVVEETLPVRDAAKNAVDEAKQLNERVSDDKKVYIPPSFEVTEAQEDMAFGIQNGLTMYLNDGTAKEAADAWKDVLKEYTASRKITKDSKVKRDDDAVNALNIIIPQLSNDLINVYTLFTNDADGTSMTSFWELSETEYISYESHSRQYTVAENMMVNFGKDYIRDLINEEMKTEDKNLKEIQKSHDKLVKKNKELHGLIAKKKKVIAEAEADIKQADRDIEQNEADQIKALEAIAAQEVIMDFVNSKLTSF